MTDMPKSPEGVALCKHGHMDPHSLCVDCEANSTEAEDLPFTHQLNVRRTHPLEVVVSRDPMGEGAIHDAMMTAVHSGLEHRYFPERADGELDLVLLRQRLLSGVSHPSGASIPWSYSDGYAALDRIEALQAKVKGLRDALEPFALHIRDDVPDDMLIETVAWTAAQHRAALAAFTSTNPDNPNTSGEHGKGEG